MLGVMWIPRTKRYLKFKMRKHHIPDIPQLVEYKMSHKKRDKGLLEGRHQDFV